MASLQAEIGELLDSLRRAGWRVERGNYWKCYCPCAQRHLKTVHLSPSDPNYLKNVKAQLRRATCWEGEGK